MSSSRRIPVRLIDCPLSIPVAYSFELIRNEKRVHRVQEFLDAALPYTEGDNALTPGSLGEMTQGLSVLAFLGGSWERCKILQNGQEDWEAIKVFRVDKGASASVTKENLRMIPEALLTKFSPLPAPLIAVISLHDFEFDIISFLAPDLLKSLSANIVTQSASVSIQLVPDGKNDSFSSTPPLLSLLFEGLMFSGEVFVRFLPEFWKMYPPNPGLWDTEKEISIKEFLFELANKNVRVAPYHPLMFNSKSKMVPSGMESRIKSKKKPTKKNEPIKSHEGDSCEDNLASPFSETRFLLSSNTSKSLCHIFMDKDPRGRKLKIPVLNITEDYVGLDADIARIIHFYRESSARGMCPLSWPALELSDSIICLGSMFQKRALSYLIPVMNMVKASKQESRAQRPYTLSCIMICPSFKTCLKLEDYCDSICPAVKVVSLFHSKELDQNTHAHILNGCEVLVTTPGSLVRHVENKVIDMTGVQMIVFEDGNLMHLFKDFSTEIGTLMKAWKDLDLRFVISAQFWSQELSTFSNAYLDSEGFPRPTVLTDAPLEAAVYGGIKASVDYLKNTESKMKRLEELLLSKRSDSKERVVVFTSSGDFAMVARRLKELETPLIQVNSRGSNMSKESILETWAQAPSLVTLLITDEMLSCLIEEIQDATSIIHLSLPTQSRTEFQFRHLVMREHFKKYKSEPPGQIFSYIFLDDKSKQALKYIYQFLLRVTKNRITDVVPEDSPEFQQLISHFVNNPSSLCSNFKRRGNCHVKSTCPHRHRFDDLTDQIKGGSSLGFIYFSVGSLHEDCPLEMTVQIMKIKSGGDVIQYNEIRQELQEKLKTYDLGDASLIETPELNQLYLWKDEKGLKRIKTFKESSQGALMFYDLESSDKAIKFEAEEHVFYECPLEHGLNDDVYPQSRATAILFGLKPIDNDPEWCRASRDAIYNSVCSKESGSIESSTSVPQVCGRIVLRSDCTFWMGEMRVSRKGLNYGVHETVVKSLKKDVLLSENNLAETDEEGISAIQKIVNSFKDESDEGSNEEEEAGFDIREEERIYPKLEYAYFSDPFEDVVISYMESPHYFYLSKLKFADLLTTLEKDIKSDVSQHKFLLGSELKEGDLILVKLHDSYHRGQIKALGEDCEVFLVDYGNIAYVPKSDIISSNNRVTEYFDRLPCQAIPCHLNNVFPLEGHWSEDCLEYLWNDIPYGEKSICEIREKHFEPFEYSVALFIPVEGGFGCLAQDLMDRGFAGLIVEDRRCNGFIGDFDNNAFLSEESSSDEEIFMPPSSKPAKDPEMTINVIQEHHEFNQEAERKVNKHPEAIKWSETSSELILTTVLSLSSDNPINPDSLYVRIDPGSVFIRYLEGGLVTHETPIPLILYDKVRPRESRISHGKGRSFKLSLTKSADKIWGSALMSGLSFQWFNFNVETLLANAGKSDDSWLDKLKPQVGLPEAYFDFSDCDDLSDYSSSGESLD